jgi:hypothetical protein
MANFGLEGLASTGRPRFAGSTDPALPLDPQNRPRPIVRLLYSLGVKRKRKEVEARKKRLEDMVAVSTASRPGVKCFGCGFYSAIWNVERGRYVCGVCEAKKADDDWLATPEGRKYAEFADQARQSATRRVAKYGRVWNKRKAVG